MEYIVKKGHRISQMTLGTVQLGMPYGINNSHGMPSEAQAREILKTAEELGVCAFDTARVYGKSETVLGNHWNGKTEGVTLITKADFEDVTPDALFDTLARGTVESLKSLKLRQLPFLLLHREDVIPKYGKALPAALNRLKAEGLVENVGISFSDKSMLTEYCDPAVYDAIQIPMNLFDSREIANGAAEALSKAGVVVFVRSVYLQGLFFKDPNTLTGKLKAAKEPLERLHALAAEQGVSLAHMALTFIREAAGVDSIVLGCETAVQLRESASLFEGYSVPAALREQITEIALSADPVIAKPWLWNK